MEIRNRLGAIDPELHTDIDKALGGYITDEEGNDIFGKIGKGLMYYANPSAYKGEQIRTRQGRLVGDPHGDVAELRQRSEDLGTNYNWHRVAARLSLDHTIGQFLDSRVVKNEGKHKRAALREFLKLKQTGKNTATTNSLKHAMFWKQLTRYVLDNAAHPEAKNVARSYDGILHSLSRLADAEENIEELSRRLHVANSVNANPNTSLHKLQIPPTSEKGPRGMQMTPHESPYFDTDYMTWLPGTAPAWKPTVQTTSKTKLDTDEGEKVKTTIGVRPKRDTASFPAQYAKGLADARTGIIHTGFLAAAELNGIRHALHKFYEPKQITPELVQEYADKVRNMVKTSQSPQAQDYIKTASQLSLPEDEQGKWGKGRVFLPESPIGLLDLSTAVGPLVKDVAADKGVAVDADPTGKFKGSPLPHDPAEPLPREPEEIENYAANVLSEGDPKGQFEEVREPFGSGAEEHYSGLHIDPAEVTHPFEFTFNLPEFEGKTDTINEIESHPENFKPGEKEKLADEMLQKAMQPKGDLDAIPLAKAKDVNRSRLPKVKPPSDTPVKKRMTADERAAMKQDSVKPKNLKPAKDAFSRVYGKVIRG
jgi:hypothetical protein